MGKRPIDEKSFLEYRFVSAPRFSPDGAMIAYVVTTANLDKNGYESDLYIYENGRTRRLTTAGDAKGFCWTNEGTLLFPAARDPKIKEAAEKGETVTAYYEIDPHGGEAREAFRLSHAAGVPRLLSNGMYAFSSEETIGEKPDKDAPCAVIDELPFWWNGSSFASRTRDALYLYDRATGAETRVTTECQTLESFSDVYDGKIYFVATEFRGVRPLFGDLYSYDTASGETKRLISGDALQNETAFRLGGRTVVLGAKGDRYGANESSSFYVLDDAGGLSLLREETLAVGSGHINSDARFGGGQSTLAEQDGFLYLTIDNYATVLRRLRADGSEETVYAPGCAIDAFDEKAGHIVTCEMRGDALAELYLDGARITRENDALTDALEISVPEHMTFTNDGVTMDGWIMKPARFVPEKTYPAIVHVHGGPRTTFGECFHNEQQLWAAKGYFVFFCNPRGSDGRGDAFADIWGKYGSIDYEDIMAFTDACLALCPQADAKRVGVTGGSYGGFMTNWIIGHTDRFRCAVSQRSISNWVSFEHTTDIGFFFTPAQHKATTATDVEALWNFSPLKYAANAVTPTLFIHSDHDYRCWMAEGLQMFSALKMKGVETRLCLFSDETHELSRSGRPKGRIRRMEEICAWMDKYLKA